VVEFKKTTKLKCHEKYIALFNLYVSLSLNNNGSSNLIPVCWWYPHSVTKRQSSEWNHYISADM